MLVRAERDSAYADFKPAYRDVVAMLADKTWRAEYERLSEDPRRYRFLDAAELVKHYPRTEAAIPRPTDHAGVPLLAAVQRA